MVNTNVLITYMQTPSINNFFYLLVKEWLKAICKLPSAEEKNIKLSIDEEYIENVPAAILQINSEHSHLCVCFLWFREPFYNGRLTFTLKYAALPCGETLHLVAVSVLRKSELYFSSLKKGGKMEHVNMGLTWAIHHGAEIRVSVKGCRLCHPS